MRLADDLVDVLVNGLFDKDITTFYFIHMVLDVGERFALFYHLVPLPPVIDASRRSLLDDQLYWQ